MDNLKEQTCCFSGHRNISFEDLGLVKKELESVIDELCRRGFDTFISGGAVGFDLLAAEAVLKLRFRYPDIRLVMALPCRDQRKMWRTADKFKYERLLMAADETIYLLENYCTGCMHLRNKFLVDNSSVCVVYMTQRHGGTAHTVQCARERNLEIINIAQRL